MNIHETGHYGSWLGSRLESIPIDSIASATSANIGITGTWRKVSNDGPPLIQQLADIC